MSHQEQIEQRVSKMVDAADRSLMSGGFTQSEYDFHIRAIDRWAEKAAKRRKAA